MIKNIFHIIFLFVVFTTNAQTVILEGNVKCDGEVFSNPTVVINNGQFQAYCDQDGHFKISNLPEDKVFITVFSQGYEKQHDTITLNKGINNYSYLLIPIDKELDAVTIKDTNSTNFSMQRLRSIEGTSIYAGKKNEIISLANVTGNTANNSGREIYGKVPGLNIWESDEAGIQLGIGARGLSPKRTESFNVRQNGYDISADALGYPESYYTPATDALEAIQIVRGAASLQYGTQFGGLLNFIMKKPSPYKIAFKTKNTYGAYNQFTTYNELSGTHKRFSYFAYYQYKRGDGWRPNSKYQQHQGFVNLNYDISEKMKISLDYTAMHYIAKQPGGLTDYLFKQDPKQSIRDRNWFQVNWHLMALRWNWNINSKISWSARVFGLLANRKALGFLGRIDRTDPLDERDLIIGDFANIGAESRFLVRYNLGKKSAGAWLIGARYYQGKTRAKQGLADDTDQPNFSFLPEEDYPIHSDFDFPSQNVSIFSENVFFVTPKWSIVPGIRFEYINTQSAGDYLYEVRHPLTDEVLISEIQQSNSTKERAFVIMGLGTHYKILNDTLEIYGNISQNYRGINFNDVKINNPNFRVDPDIHDEKGYNADIGLRGQIGEVFTYDLSGFYLRYNDRIGEIIKTDTTNYTIYRYRTNVADAHNLGAEIFLELDWWKLFSKNKNEFNLTTFVNLSYIYAKYLESENTAIAGNNVEMVPPFTIRSGINFGYKNFKFSYQLSYVAEHYSDATNAEATSSAIYGKIPAYLVMDIGASYKLKKWLSFSGGVNNLTNEKYFTRRATGYPGPGILPSTGITGYVSLSFYIHSKK